MLDLFAILITISAVFGFINYKWLKLPTTIGVMLISVIVGTALKVIDSINPDYLFSVKALIVGFDFSSFVLDFILCFLLFAGALHVNIMQLKGVRATVFLYSTLGVIISTLVVGLLSRQVLMMFGYDYGWVPCFLFGALISPTDPIAVIGILSKYNIPQRVKTEIIGESLFNDGVGVVVFTVIYTLISYSPDGFSAKNIAEVFSVEVFGGLGIGFTVGYIGYRLMKAIDHYQTEILITLAVVTGGYSIAHQFHASGPLAMVVAGLIIGNKGKTHAMSDITAEYIDKFWELIDEICNTILFVLIGLQIFLVPFDPIYLLVGLVLILVALIARFVSLVPGHLLFNRNEPDRKLNFAVLVWGGLRGGISIALALTLGNKVEGSSLFVVCTYCIVLFSVLVQGLSIKKLLGKYSQD